MINFLLPSFETIYQIYASNKYLKGQYRDVEATKNDYSKIQILAC